jgi:hypothetical protein
MGSSRRNRRRGLVSSDSKRREHGVAERSGARLTSFCTPAPDLLTQPTARNKRLVREREFICKCLTSRMFLRRYSDKLVDSAIFPVFSLLGGNSRTGHKYALAGSHPGGLVRHFSYETRTSAPLRKTVVAICPGPRRYGSALWAAEEEGLSGDALAPVMRPSAA